MKSSFLILFSLFLNVASAQILTGASIRYDDGFGEWLLYTDIDGEVGTLESTWRLQNRWTDWNFGVRQKNGTIRAVWQDRTDEWELRAHGKTVTMRQIWRNDVREWRINDGAITVDFKMKNRNDPYEWIMDDPKYGVFYAVTEQPQDARDWMIQDDTDVSVSFPMRLAMLFIALNVAAPKY
ncbi:MAG: hypothetical protein RL329_1450 [Bacteroidota bacterium]|jgi:hypothetical protein